MQIKEDKQLVELMESVDHMSGKFNDFEKERKEKEKLMSNLKEISSLKRRFENL